MKKRRMSEQGFETRLARMLQRRLERSGGSVSTFQEAGVLTMNRGLVVTLPNRQSFQVTVIESTARY